MNAPIEAIDQTVSYITVCGLGILAIIFFNVISGMFRGIGDSKSPFILMMISCVINIVGDVLLVGYFDMAASGAAIATVFAQFISVLASLMIMKKRGIGFEFHKESFKWTKYETVKILKFGIPIAAQEALTGISFAVIMAILNSFGLVASAGVGIAEKVVGIMFLVPGVSLFQVGLATPCATVFAITITTVYIVVYERRKDTLKDYNEFNSSFVN